MMYDDQVVGSLCSIRCAIIRRLYDFEHELGATGDQAGGFSHPQLCTLVSFIIRTSMMMRRSWSIIS